MPFPRHNLEAVFRLCNRCRLLSFLDSAGVNSIGEKFFCIIPALSCISKGHRRIIAKRKGLSFTGEGVIKPP